jgi:hypothetical protein
VILKSDMSFFWSSAVRARLLGSSLLLLVLSAGTAGAAALAGTLEGCPHAAQASSAATEKSSFAIFIKGAVLVGA